MVITAGIQGVGGSNYEQRLSKMSLLGPGWGRTQRNGVRSAAIAGLNVQGSGQADHLTINGFSSAVTFGGSGLYGDHISLNDIIAAGCGHGLNLIPGTITQGDLHLSHLHFETTLLAIAVAMGSGGFDGAGMVNCGLYAPFGFYRYYDSTATSSPFVMGGDFSSVNIEDPQNAAFFDELYTSSSLGGTVAGFSFRGACQNPGPPGSGNPWSATFAITNITGSQITVTDPYYSSAGVGFVFRKGMTVTGAGFTAGTTVTAITGTWPSSSYTLTLSIAPGSPTTAVIGQPIVATVAAGFIHDIDFTESITSEATIIAPFMTGQVIYNVSGSVGAVNPYLTAGQPMLAPLSSTNSYGIQWGRKAYGAARYETITGRWGAAVAQYDLVEAYVDNNGVDVRVAQGLGAPCVGVAQMAATGPNSVDLLCHGWATVNNKTSVAIPANSLLKADPAHPGGVTPITGLDGGNSSGTPSGGFDQVIGMSLATATIAANSTGLAHLWL